VVLVGLACKNRHPDRRVRPATGSRKARPGSTAALEAARVRLAADRDDLGVLCPTWCRRTSQTGAGAEMRRSLGTAVLWGAFGVTLFGIFLTPVFLTP